MTKSGEPEAVDVRDGYAVIDMEMTGPNPLTGLIIEMAIGVSLPGRNLVTDRVLVKIDQPIPKRIVRLTGISDRDLAASGISVDDALAWFVEKTDGLHLVGHSIIKSDRQYLLEAARRHCHAVKEGKYPRLCIDEGNDLPLKRFIDTAGLFKGYKLGEYQEAEESHQEYAQRVIALPARGLQTGLTAACEDLGISTSRISSHRAAGDVVQNHRLFERLLELNPPRM